jgi:hypothetical protein
MNRDCQGEQRQRTEQLEGGKEGKATPRTPGMEGQETRIARERPHPPASQSADGATAFFAIGRRIVGIGHHGDLARVTSRYGLRPWIMILSRRQRKLLASWDRSRD